MAQAHLKVVDTQTGEIIRTCPHCDQEELIDALNKEIGKLCRRIDSLERDREAERLAHPKRVLIEKLHSFWQQQANKPRSGLTSDRHDAIEKLLRSRTDEEIRWAVVGACRFPYYSQTMIGHRVSDAPFKGAKRYDNWSHLAEKADRFEELANLGYQWCKANDFELEKIDTSLPEKKKRLKSA